MLLPLSVAFASPDAASTFARLTALAGRYEAAVDGGTVRVDLALVSRGSALVETFTTRSGVTTVSVLHLDGDHLVYTHYCAMGNQPRLWAGPADGLVTFRFHDATNLAPGASHLDEVRFAVTDAAHFTKTEIYTDGQTREETALPFVRVAP